MRCVYQIQNILNNKSYIGSTKDLRKRILRHLNDLKRGKHHSIPLQRAYDKYGDVFNFIILEETENLFEREQYWIDRILPEYNIGSVGGGDNISNHPKRDEIRLKQSIASKLAYQNMSEKKKENRNNKGSKNPHWKGGISKPKCKQCDKNISYGHKFCKKCLDKTGNKNSFYGKQHSEESKEKIRLKNKGRLPPNARPIEIDGTQYKSYSEAAKALGVHTSLISYRVRKGIYRNV